MFMDLNDQKQTNPLQNLFLDIKKILDFLEVKDKEKADSNETNISKQASELWMNAMEYNDSYLSYRVLWDFSMFQEIESNVKVVDVDRWMANPYSVPIKFRDNLLKRGREIYLSIYEEHNNYYRTLIGLPPLNTPESDFVYLSDSMRNQLHVSNEPIHLLSPIIQNNFMGTDEYKKILEENPDKEYLKYLGIYKIDLYAARKAKDFEIIRYPLGRSDINPNLLSNFSKLYDDYREYVMTALYNENLEGLYVGYRPFMGQLIMMFTLMQISNKAVEAVNGKKFLDDAILHIVLSMYDIPNSLLLTNEVKRNLVINMMKLVKEKGTSEIYYDLVRILGYNDITISKLLMMKGQQFDESNNYRTVDDKGEVITTLDEAKSDTIGVEPYFIQVDIEDKNPYDTITSGNAPVYDYHKIVDSDPTWWDLPDTRSILKNSNYTVSDSKYIMIEATVQQMKYLFESIYFTRMILDNKENTDTFLISIPEIFGTEMISIYDLMVYIVAATCMNNGLTGEINSYEGKLLATAGFNFDIDIDSFTEFLDTTSYVDKDKVRSFISNLSVINPADVNRLFNDVLYPMREWLELMMSRTSNRHEYNEYEMIYRALYTYDASKNSFLEDFEMPIEIIRKKYGLTEEDLRMYQHFYPRTMTGKTITVDEYNESRYKHPFISRNNEVDWWIHVVIETPYGEDDRGYVYFHDILNSDDIRKLTNPDGTRVFMDWEDGDKGWEINQQAVDKALYLIDHLDEHGLSKGKFQVNTPILNSSGNQYYEGDLLPANIRSGIYKEILKDKIRMDIEGLSEPPKTYQEYLYRKNEKLYNLLLEGDRFNTNKEAWLNDIMKIILAVETELDLHMKYFEQSVVGSELFFNPLITLINHFKSSFVSFSKTGVKYVFGDKMDAGGNSNMFKLFDEVRCIIHFVTLAASGYESQFGLFDTEHKMKYKIILKDRSEMLRMNPNGFDVNERTCVMGSLRLVDEVKLFLNGEPVDPPDQYAYWRPGETGTGRWSNDEEILMRARKNTERVSNLPVDLDGWKDFVESYNGEV